MSANSETNGKMPPQRESQKRFTWSAGGLAGCALGASLWMPATAITSGWPGLGIAMSFITAFLIFVGTYVIWQARQKMSAYQGLMILLGVGFVSTLFFFVSAHLLGLTVLVSWPGGKRVTPLEGAWVLLLYPALAAECWFLDSGQSLCKPGVTRKGGPAAAQSANPKATGEPRNGR